MIDPNVPNSDHAPSRSTILDVALQIGLVGFLIYACSRYISPFSDLLLWSTILAVMLYPLHLRLAVRLGNRWSALLIGLVGVAVMLVAMVTVVTSIASSLYSLIVGLHDQSLTVPPPPRMACRAPAGGPETNGGLGARRHQHAGGGCQIRRGVERTSGAARVVRRWPGRRPTIVRSFFRDSRRHRRLRQGRRRFRSAPAGTFYRQRGAGAAIWLR